MTIVVYRSTELFGTSACKVCCVGIVVSTATASSTRPSPASSAVVVLSTWFGTHGYVVALSQQTWIVESAVEKDGRASEAVFGARYSDTKRRKK